MPFRARSFTDVGYHQERLSSMGWDDKVASFILSMHWSRGEGAAGGRSVLSTKVGPKKRVKERQLESHLDCVAAMHADGKWYFAANRLVLMPVDIELADHSLGRPLDGAEFFGGVNYYNTLAGNYEIVADGGVHMHAEMKIIRRLHALGKLKVRMRIGVSKPCCPRCKQVLDRWQIDYTSFHDVIPPGDTWIDPGVGHAADDLNLLRDLFG